MRVRGLKHLFGIEMVYGFLSHPVRVRGLKQKNGSRRPAGRLVAPRAGAWIETSWMETGNVLPESHPVRVRGLKQADGRHHNTLQGRTPCGCVD